MSGLESQGNHRPLAQSPEDIRSLHRLCREGHLYDVDRWIADGKPVQLAPDAAAKGTRPKTALQIVLETGQHSLAALLLRNGYRLELEHYGPLEVALQSRRWDLVNLLVEWGADLKTVDVYTILNTYNGKLYERLWAAGYDLTESDEMGSVLGHGTTNRPLLGFVKRHRRDPRIQRQLNIALGYHVREGNERGVNLCLWAGADPHAPAPNPSLGSSRDPDPEDGEGHFIGWSAIEEAANHGHLQILKRLRPDPARDDFDELYRCAKYEFIVAFVAKIQPPRDLTRIMSWHLWWLADRFPWGHRMGTSVIEAVLKCGVRWSESDPEQLTQIRRALLKLRDDDLRKVMLRLRRADVCAPETFQELARTPKVQQRLLALGLVKKPVDERERRRNAAFRLMCRYDRVTLYEQVWSQAVQEVAKSYGVSGVRLGKVCRVLQVPVPKRGYWARVRNGQRVRKPPLPDMKCELAGRGGDDE